MSDPHGTSSATHDPGHGVAAHADAGHGPEDGHAGEVLGPIDIVMWGVGLLGVSLGLLVALCTAFAVGVL